MQREERSYGILQDDPNFERKLDEITEGAQPYVKEHLLTKITRVNANIIISYILAFQVESNPRLGYKIETILLLKQLVEFHHPLSFEQMTRDHIIAFLDRLRKPEALDPLHKWIGTYENNRIILLRFFSWLYAPDIPYDQRSKPKVMENIPRLKWMEKEVYTDADIWTYEDDLLFCKYCPSKRDKAYLRVARDTGCRASEMVNMRINDLASRQMPDGSHVAEVLVNGKTGTRTVRIYYAYPYLKDWLSNGHPFPNVKTSPIFCGWGRKSNGKKIQPRTIWKIFNFYKEEYFPKLLKDRLIEPEDVQKVTDLLKKPWNPHFRRHTAATEISKRLKDPVLVNKYMGWSQSGNTRLRYQHYGNNDAIEAMLIADGLLPADGIKNKQDLLKPKICPNCGEENRPDNNKFCIKCKFVLSFDAYNETVNAAENAQREMEEMKQHQQNIEKTIASMMRVIRGESKTMEVYLLDDKVEETTKENKNSLVRCQRHKQ